MDITIIYAFAAVLTVAGASFLYLLLGRGPEARPQTVVEWAGVVLSVLLIASAAFLVTLTFRTPPETGPLDAQGYPTLAQAEMDAAAPNFSFRLVADGTERDLAAYRGKVVLINFWATWCAPCLEELPDLNELQNRYEEQGLVVLNISDETRNELLAFQRDLPLETVSGYVAAPDSLPEPYRRTIAIRPNSYVVDRDGVIREYVMGARDLERFEEIVRPYLQGAVTKGSLSDAGSAMRRGRPE